jgi:hypothetical protein
LQKGFFDIDAFCHHNGAKDMRNAQDGIDQDVIITVLRIQSWANSRQQSRLLIVFLSSLRHV